MSSLHSKSADPPPPCRFLQLHEHRSRASGKWKSGKVGEQAVADYRRYLARLAFLCGRKARRLPNNPSSQEPPHPRPFAQRSRRAPPAHRRSSGPAHLFRRASGRIPLRTAGVRPGERGAGRAGGAPRLRPRVPALPRAGQDQARVPPPSPLTSATPRALHSQTRELRAHPASLQVRPLRAARPRVHRAGGRLRLRPGHGGRGRRQLHRRVKER